MGEVGRLSGTWNSFKRECRESWSETKQVATGVKEACMAGGSEVVRFAGSLKEGWDSEREADTVMLGALNTSVADAFRGSPRGEWRNAVSLSQETPYDGDYGVNFRLNSHSFFRGIGRESCSRFKNILANPLASVVWTLLVGAVVLKHRRLFSTSLLAGIAATYHKRAGEKLEKGARGLSRFYGIPLTFFLIYAIPVAFRKLPFTGLLDKKLFTYPIAIMTGLSAGYYLAVEPKR